MGTHTQGTCTRYQMMVEKRRISVQSDREYMEKKGTYLPSSKWSVPEWTTISRPIGTQHTCIYERGTQKTHFERRTSQHRGKIYEMCRMLTKKKVKTNWRRNFFELKSRRHDEHFGTHSRQSSWLFLFLWQNETKFGKLCKGSTRKMWQKSFENRNEKSGRHNARTPNDAIEHENYFCI